MQIMRILLPFLVWVGLWPVASLRAAVTLSLDPSAQLGVIHPLSYGSNHLDVQRATLRRVGGNRMTGYNWENNASNAGSDWFHSSDYYLLGQVGLPQNGAQAPAAVLIQYVQQFRAAGSLGELITVPAAGFVAADADGPVSVTQTAPSSRWKAVLPVKPGWPGSWSTVPDASDGVVYVDEEVAALVDRFGAAASGGVRFYSIDNEPALWSSTHPRLHPNPVTYAELLARVSSTAQAVLNADPSAEITAPASYGWAGMADLQSAPDAGLYNPTYGWFLGYFLHRMAQASATAGRRLLHYLDVHWYPEARDSSGTRIVFGNPDKTDADASAARMQAPRSLWDPSYTENSWVAQWGTGGPIQLIPRLRASIANWYPGTQIIISEYDFGAPDHISGGIAQADVLGILGKYGVLGCRWGAVAPNSYVQAAFDLYRNYDGAGSSFGDLSFAAQSSDIATVTVYAAKRSTDPDLFTVVALNKNTAAGVTTTVNLSLSGRSIQSVQWWRFTGASSAITPAASPAFGAASFTVLLPAMSANLFVVRVAASGTPTFTPTPTPSRSPSPTSSPTRSATPTRSPSFSPSPTRTPSPSATPTPLPTLSCPRISMMFYPYWARYSLPPSAIPWDKITHLAHAFFRPLADGSLDVPPDYLDPTLISEAHARGVKVIASAGGAGSGSQYWAAMAADPAARTAFVNNLYVFLRDHGYDGFDIDWEFPSNAADRSNLTLLVKALRAKFASSPAPAPSWLIMGDLNYGSYYGQWWDVAALKDDMDFFNLMIYDMYGSWTSVSGHNAALFDSTLPGAWTNNSGTYSLDYYIGRGLPARQILYGLPFYGYSFNTEDLYQTCPGGCSTTSYAYKDLPALIGAGWTRVWDASAQSPYLKEDAGARVITYDDPQSIYAKAYEAVWNRGVAGIFAWELSNDRMSDGSHPLLQAAWNALQCPLPSPTPTATLSPTFSISPTHSLSPTITPSFTISPTYTVSPTLTPVPEGPAAVEALVPLPQPNPRVLKLKLDKPVEEVELRLYGSAWVRVAAWSAGPQPAGWVALPAAPLTLGLANGFYYGLVRVRRGGAWSEERRFRLVLAR